MERVQVVLRPDEAKRIICQGLFESEPVKRALENGILAVHPSSTTYFLRELIEGRPGEGIWLVGMIAPRGTCIEGRCQQEFEKDQYQDLSDPNNFPFTWVYRQGVFETGQRLEEILEELGPDDVYIKGVNAIDSYGCVGVLLASLSGGTIGRAVKAQKKRGFTSIYTASHEKLIPGSIRELAKETGRQVTTDALGIPCGLLPIQSPPFTEVQALNNLFGIEAFPIASGGVGGAEGSIMMVLKGEKGQLEKAMHMVKSIKGTRLPEVIMPDCSTCHSPGCLFAGKKINN